MRQYLLGVIYPVEITGKPVLQQVREASATTGRGCPASDGSASETAGIGCKALF